MTKIFGQDVKGPPYRLDITDRMIGSFMGLPIASDCRISMTSLWPQLHCDTREAFIRAISTKSAMHEVFHRLCFHYAKLAHPQSGAWPEPEGHEILDECFVGTAPVWSFRYLINGKRLVSAGTPADRSWMTWLEFETKYGLSIHSHMRTVGASVVRSIQNATRWTRREPAIFDVSYSTSSKAGSVGRVDIAAFTCEQVKNYCSRRRLTVLAMDEHTAIFQNGAYRKGDLLVPKQPVNKGDVS